MDKIITVLGYKYFITEMSDAPDCCICPCLLLKKGILVWFAQYFLSLLLTILQAQ